MKYARACIDCRNWFLADWYRQVRCPYCALVHRADNAERMRQYRQRRKAQFAREYAAAARAQA